jgi:hypothetical protein
MSFNVYQYDVKVRVAVIAASEDEAMSKLDQGQVQQISMERELFSTTEVAI